MAAVDDTAVAESFVPRLLGGGYIAFTVDQGQDTDRYQGIVALEGHTLSECTHSYFQNSEQIDAGIKLAAGRDADGDWRAAALMVQRMPFQKGLPGSPTEDDYEEGWRTAVTLMSSSTATEMLNGELAPDQLLYRLFASEGVRAYQAHPERHMPLFVGTSGAGPGRAESRGSR